MADRVPSDHEAVTTHRVHVETAGATSRRRIPVPDGLDVADGDVVRLSLGGEATHARVATSLSGGQVLAGAFENARLARSDGEGEDRLRAWLADAGVGAGDPLLVDVVTQGYAYGLRRPGERVVYAAVDPPRDSLSDIARDVDG